jgi:glycosyltransferase involved in cell wall biosynthesis/ribosomal protein S18 acetylase RimI-like enzyme
MTQTELDSRPIKVLHVVGDSRFGGIAGIILGLGRIARAEGWKVDVLTTDPFVQQAVRQQGLGVVSLDVIRREIRPFWDLGGMLRLRRFLQAEPYRIVHTHTSKGGFVGRLAARLAGVPVIVHTAHGFAFHEHSPRPVRLFYTALERMASQWCNRIITVSEFHRNWALELGLCRPADILAIPNGTSEPQFSEHFDAADLRRQLGVANGEVLILSVARLAPDKGIDHLIAAAAKLPKREPRHRIFIAGDGPMRPRLEEMVREHRLGDMITFLGFRSDTRELMAAADLVVLASMREGLSITLLEAMAASKPIIATAIGSHREVASQASVVKLVPPSNPSALADALEQVTQNPLLMARLGAGARSLFERRYTESRMLDAYRELYLGLLGRKSTALLVSSKSSLANIDAPLRPSVRQASLDDLDGIVAAHQKAFPQFFLTQLGPEFLGVYYRLVLTYGAGIVLVSSRQDEINGFVCGFMNPGEFYRRMWQHRWAFVAPALSALARRPSLATQVLNGVKRIQTSACLEQERSCELSSIAVLPEASTQGLGRTLMRAFVAQSWSMKADCIYLTTDAERNPRANKLYHESGFQLARRFLQQRGRWMNEYVICRKPAESGVLLP